MLLELISADSLKILDLSVQRGKALLTSSKRYGTKIDHIWWRTLTIYMILLQQVMSKKDQEQYWCLRDKPYSYISVDSFIDKFQESNLGVLVKEELSKPFQKSQSRKDGLCFRKYSLGKWEMLKACSRREYLLMKRNSFIYLFKSGLVTFLLLCKEGSIIIYHSMLNPFFLFSAVSFQCASNNDRFSTSWSYDGCSSWELSYGFSLHRSV